MSLLFTISGSCVLRFSVSISFSLYFCLFFAWGLGRTSTIPYFPIYCFPWEDCISGHRQVCIPTVVGVQALARRILLSTICVLSSPPHTLACSRLLCFIMLLFFFFARVRPRSAWPHDLYNSKLVRSIAVFDLDARHRFISP